MIGPWTTLQTRQVRRSGLRLRSVSGAALAGLCSMRGRTQPDCRLQDASRCACSLSRCDRAIKSVLSLTAAFCRYVSNAAGFCFRSKQRCRTRVRARREYAVRRWLAFFLELRLPAEEVGLHAADDKCQHDADDHHHKDCYHHLRRVGTRLRFDDQLAKTALSANKLADNDAD